MIWSMSEVNDLLNREASANSIVDSPFSEFVLFENSVKCAE